MNTVKCEKLRIENEFMAGKCRYLVIGCVEKLHVCGDGFRLQTFRLYLDLFEWIHVQIFPFQRRHRCTIVVKAKSNIESLLTNFA